MGFPHGTVVKNLPSNAGDRGSIPGSEGSPREGSGNPLQDFCLENPKDSGAWEAEVHAVTKNQKPVSNQARARELMLLLSRFSHVRLCVTP